MKNHLATESSPYLLQHAQNPVDWYPWGDEALERARKEDKPILLSIGYSACHWCHVMAHESFENTPIAELMNASFINIKVDREERPDLDQIYMSAVQLMTGSGGWPLTVFLTPEGEPFFGGTYFPPDDRHNRPGFRRVLGSIAEAFKNRRDEIASNARTIIQKIDSQTRQSPGEGVISEDLLDRSHDQIASKFDSQHGGFGQAPKFPPSMTIDFLLRYHHRTGQESPLAMARLTLDKMALGGIYDHIGGGFHRYSTDDHWLVPHFEKMLYDNALLASVYLDAFRVTGNPLYRERVTETLGFVTREMLDPAGGFYSTLDADSEGVEGKFYVWSLGEFSEVIGDDSSLLARFLDVSDEGNFEQQNILNIRNPLKTFADEQGVDPATMESKIGEAKRKLLERREARVRPGRDEKILTDWNGLMLRAFSDAAFCLDREDYRRIAEANAEFILATMWDGKRLLHSFKNGSPRFNGYLDDYANLADGLLALYELTFEERWLDKAIQLADVMIQRFWDSDYGGFFFTSNDHDPLIARTKEYFDNATPSGNSVAASLLVRLARLLDRDDYREKSEQITRVILDYIEKFPAGFGRMLAAVDFEVGPTSEIALIGSTEPFLPALRKHYHPRRVLGAGVSDRIALLRNRPMVDGKATAYICEDFVCRQPVTDAEVFEIQLRDVHQPPPHAR